MTIGLFGRLRQTYSTSTPSVSNKRNRIDIIGAIACEASSSTRHGTNTTFWDTGTLGRDGWNGDLCSWETMNQIRRMQIKGWIHGTQSRQDERGSKNRHERASTNRVIHNKTVRSKIRENPSAGFQKTSRSLPRSALSRDCRR